MDSEKDSIGERSINWQLLGQVGLHVTRSIPGCYCNCWSLISVDNRQLCKVITLRTCTRGKAIGCVVIVAIITQTQKLPNLEI